MAELIDKERAYTALKHEQYTHGLSFSAEAFEKAARIIDQMPKIESEPVNRWIPVEDALPEQSGVYLAYFTFKDGTHATYIAYINAGCHLGSITHWMPLPEPPESEVQHD